MEAELPAMFQSLIPVAQYVLMVAVGFLLLLAVLVPVTLFCAVLCTYLPGLVLYDFSDTSFEKRLQSLIRRIKRKYKIAVNYYLKETVPTSSISSSIVHTLGLEQFNELKSSLEESQLSIGQFLRANKKDGSLPDTNSPYGAEKVEELTNQISKLENMIDVHASIAVPDLDMSEADYDRRKEGTSSLVIFIPLLIFVIILNTYLLSTFFSDLLGPVNDYLFGWGVPIQLSHVVAFMFTAIEVGIGVYFASVEYHQEKKTTVTSVIRTFAWVVLAMLIFVEFFIYLQLSVYSSLGENLVDSYFGYSTIEFFIAGWMSIFGPIIVMSLFIFGHQGTTAYMKVMHTDALSSLKKSLDDSDKKINELSGLVERIQENLKSLKVTSSEIHSDVENSNDVVSNIQSDEVCDLLKQLDLSIGSVVSEVKDCAESTPESTSEAFERTHELPLREQNAFLGHDFMVGFVWLSCVIGFGAVAQFFIQNNISNLGSPQMFYLLEFIASILIGLLISITGYLALQSATLVLINGRYQIRSTELQTYIKWTAPLVPACIFVWIVWLHWGDSSVYPHLLGVFVLGLVLFLMGHSMVRSVYSIRIAMVMLYYQVLVLCIQVARAITSSAQEVLLFFSYIVRSCGYPWAKFYPTFFHWK
jgi:hypothetical protein